MGENRYKIFSEMQVDRHTCPEELSTPRKKDLVLTQIRKIKSKETEIERKAERALYGVKEINNPLLRLSVDMFM